MHVVIVQVFTNGGCSIFTRGRGAHVRLCPRPCSSTHRSAKPTTERHRGPRNTARSVLSRPLHPCTHRMCVIAKGLGSLQRLAHAAGHGQHSSASTSQRLFCVTCFLTVGHKDQDSEKSAIISPEDACRRRACQSVRFAPPGCYEKKKKLVPIADSFDCPQSPALPIDIVLGDERAHCETRGAAHQLFSFSNAPRPVCGLIHSVLR